MAASQLPRISFGIIVLNGEPFTRYCIRALYPFAHQIIVVEGGSKHAAAYCTPDGHSTDGTLEVLRQLKADEDPDDKLQIVTRDGYWAEKDEQSQAYAARATGDWLWQVDIDEFYLPSAMQRVLDLVASGVEITSAAFDTVTFWGDTCYTVHSPPILVEGFRRLFRWGPGYRYTQHRPPVVVNERGQDVRLINWYDAKKMAELDVRMFHYSMLFPFQVLSKCGYYQALARGRDEAENKDRVQQAKFSNAARWAENSYLTLNNPFKVHYIDWHPSWLEHYRGPQPPEVVKMMNAVRAGEHPVEVRDNQDVERLLADRSFLRKRRLIKHIVAPLWIGALRAKEGRPWWLRRDLFWRLSGRQSL